MGEHVYWLLEISIKDGEKDKFEELMAEMVKRTRDTEPGTLSYEWQIGEDGKTVHLYERYEDSAATMIHLASFGENFAQRFLGAADPTRFVVYGNPNDEVRQALAGFNPIYMQHFGGFSR